MPSEGRAADNSSTTLRRSSLNVKYSQQYPYRQIVRKPSGKSLVNAQRLWRDGTALLDRLGLPTTFEIEDIPELVQGASLREKKEIFELCGQGLLTESKAADPDVTDFFLLNGLYTSGVACETHYADVVYAICNQFFYLNRIYKIKSKVVDNIQTGFKKAIAKSSDPRILVLQANFLIIYESPRSTTDKIPFESSIYCLNLAIESFEHQMKNFKEEYKEGSKSFEVYYILSTVLSKKMNIMLSNKKHLRTLTTKSIDKMYKDYKFSLELFLKEAPDCHWYVPSACFMLSTEWLRRKTPPTGAKIKELLKRNKQEAMNSSELFDKGIESYKTFIKWNPHELIDKKPEYLEAIKLQKILKDEGYREKEIPKLPVSTVEMRPLLDEGNLTWNEWFRWNLTDARNIQLVYLFLFFGILLDPIFNIFGFFVQQNT